MKRRPSIGDEIAVAKLRVFIKRQLRRAGIEIPAAINFDLFALRKLRDEKLNGGQR